MFFFDIVAEKNDRQQCSNQEECREESTESSNGNHIVECKSGIRNRSRAQNDANEQTD